MTNIRNWFGAAEQKNEKKRELAKRLVEMNARKREERLAEDRQQLDKLKAIKGFHERNEMKDFQKRLKQNGLSNKDDLEVSELGLKPMTIEYILEYVEIYWFYILVNYSKIENDCSRTESNRSSQHQADASGTGHSE